MAVAWFESPTPLHFQPFPSSWSWWLSHVQSLTFRSSLEYPACTRTCPVPLSLARGNGVWMQSHIYHRFFFSEPQFFPWTNKTLEKVSSHQRRLAEGGKWCHRLGQRGKSSLVHKIHTQGVQWVKVVAWKKWVWNPFM